MAEAKPEGKANRDARSLPVRDPWESLTPTARKILAAAKHILTEEGFSALTLEAIAGEAGVNKASTRYYFGNKDGLLETIVDEIVLDECAAIAVEVAADASDEERIEGFIQNARHVATDVESFGGFFDILPHAVRTELLRKRMVSLYEIWYAWNLEWLGLDRLGNSDARVKALGRLTAAMLDGIAIQAMLHAGDFDPEPLLDAMRHTLELLLRDVRSQAADSAQG